MNALSSYAIMEISLTACINSKSQLSTPENDSTERREPSSHRFLETMITVLHLKTA